jgi:hypothetical protein
MQDHVAALNSQLLARPCPLSRLLPERCDPSAAVVFFSTKDCSTAATIFCDSVVILLFSVISRYSFEAYGSHIKGKNINNDTSVRRSHDHKQEGQYTENNTPALDTDK